MTVPGIPVATVVEAWTVMLDNLDDTNREWVLAAYAAGARPVVTRYTMLTVEFAGVALGTVVVPASADEAQA